MLLESAEREGRFMNKFKIGLAAICLGLWGSPALAQTASSSAFALDVNQTVTAPNVATVTVDIGPLAPTSGTAPPDFNNSNSVASVNQNIALTSGVLGVGGVSEAISTGLLTSNSTGTATGANATATVNNFSLNIGTNAFLSSLFNLSATTIQSFSQANTVGGFDASGTTTIEGLVLGGSILGGLVIDGSAFINPAPNTVLFNGGGLTIILNQQILSAFGITTNAINIIFDDFAVGTGLKDGNIIIASTTASATTGATGAVPEPTTWAMMLIGFGAVGVSMRRRKKVQLAPQAA